MVECLLCMNNALSSVLKCHQEKKREEFEEEEDISLTEFCSTVVFSIDSQHFNC